MCAPAFFQSNEMKKNDCYKCPYREQVPGSAHSKCTAIENGRYKEIISRSMIKLDSHGLLNGWCWWPYDFEPVWVDCYLPIKNNEKQ